MNLNVLYFSEQGTVKNIQITEETTNSFRVSWEAAPGPVIRYHLGYVPVSSDYALQNAQTVGPETTIVLQRLLPATKYRVSVAAKYTGGLGDDMKAEGTTKECEYNGINCCNSIVTL